MTSITDWNHFYLDFSNTTFSPDFIFSFQTSGCTFSISLTGSLIPVWPINMRRTSKLGHDILQFLPYSPPKQSHLCPRLSFHLTDMIHRFYLQVCPPTFWLTYTITNFPSLFRNLYMHVSISKTWHVSTRHLDLVFSPNALPDFTFQRMA